MELNFAKTEDRLQATFLIVPDVTKPPERAEWAACLKGSILLDKSCLMSGNGMVVAYKKHQLCKGKLFLTENFKMSHGQVAQLLVGSKNWKIVEDSAKAKIILKVSSEDGFNGPYSFTKQGFLDHIKKIDMKRSGMLKV